VTGLEPTDGLSVFSDSRGGIAAGECRGPQSL
jgi:hypothetical protein